MWGNLKERMGRKHEEGREGLRRKWEGGSDKGGSETENLKW